VRFTNLTRLILWSSPMIFQILQKGMWPRFRTPFMILNSCTHWIMTLSAGQRFLDYNISTSSPSDHCPASHVPDPNMYHQTEKCTSHSDIAHHVHPWMDMLLWSKLELQFEKLNRCIVWWLSEIIQHSSLSLTWLDTASNLISKALERCTYHPPDNLQN
jgi:hypothetical protein